MSPGIRTGADPSLNPTLIKEKRVRADSLIISELLEYGIVLSEDWESLPPAIRSEITDCSDPGLLLSMMVRHGLLTPYQADRLEAGSSFGLIVDHYRVLDRLGAGAMGVVFKAENIRMRRPVALKVLVPSHERDPRLLQRFFSEIRAVAQLQHPNIVAALDAGETAAGQLGMPALHYLVLEYVPGSDLEELVLEQGPMPVPKACDIIHQIASALVEASKRNLVHRDIKPSNIKVTPEGQAKLLDFGLSRSYMGNRLTEPGTILGTVDYMAPEQLQDASTVDIRADIYGLGATLFWCVTGRPPFISETRNPQELAARFFQPPPSARTFRSDLPIELDALITRMLAVSPDDRYATPQMVMKALLPFINPEMREYMASFAAPNATPSNSPSSDGTSPSPRQRAVLIVDDEPSIRSFCRYALQAPDVQFDEAPNGREALEVLKNKPVDLILLDVDMPVMTGQELLQHVREHPPSPHLKIIMFSGRSPSDAMAQMMVAGADDYLTKPFSVIQLQARARALLRLKDAQDRTSLLNKRLLTVNSELERSLSARDSDLVQARNALVLALAKLVEYRDSETGSHLIRLQRYCRCLAAEAAQMATLREQIDGHFIDMLECCAPLHDIGKVGLPDHILMKPGKLTPDERVLMQAHTVIGADTLKEVAKQHGFALAFLQMAMDIARHHHERFDGNGYPDRLAGIDIPLSARLVTIADVYDALRSRRVYKPALAHSAAVQMMTESSPGQLDPVLVKAFEKCAPRFEQIFREVTD